MKIVNLTPHAINIIAEDKDVTIPASGNVARCSVASKKVDSLTIEGVEVDVMASTYGEVEGLPAEKAGTIYIVSALVAGRCSGRMDVFIPNDAVRDEAGRIIGCRSLARI